jgi:hypothetical protein
MNESQVLEPAVRIDRLEQEAKHLASRLKAANRQISFLQVATLLLFGALAGGGYYAVTSGKLKIDGLSPPVSKTVESTEFGLYNRFGTRVVFDTDDRFGQPRVTFLDDKKRLRMRLMVLPDGGGTGAIAFYDHTGWRGMLRMEEDMSASLKLVGEGQKGGIAMTVDRDGSPRLKLTDKAGKVLWEAPTKSN